MEHNRQAESSDYTRLKSQAIMVDPRQPVSAPVPITPSRRVQSSSQDEGTSVQDRGPERSTSRRKRAGEQGMSKAVQAPDPLPAAPDVPTSPRSPRGPPVSYRDPYSNEDIPPVRSSSNKSFAARAGAVPDRVDPSLANSYAANNMPLVNKKERSPRWDNTQIQAMNYAPTQQPNRPSSSSNVEPPPPQQYSNSSTPRLHSSSERRRAQPAVNVEIAQAEAEIGSPPVRSGTSARRTSAGATERRSEWATDRSPLQKLEVKLNDISKEEKRARVREAEQLLRDSKAEKAARTSTSEELQDHPIASKRVSSNSNNSGRRISQSRHVSAGEASPLRNDDDGYVPSRNPPKSADVLHMRESRTRYSSGYGDAAETQSPKLSNHTANHAQSQRGQRRSVDTSNHRNGADRGVRFQTDAHGDEADEIIGHSDTYENSNEHKNQQMGSKVSNATKAKEQRSPSLEQQISSGDENYRGVLRRNVPEQQKQLYINRVEIPKGEDSAAAYGGIPDPVRGHETRSHNHGPKYEVAPQTAAGINARQKIGFGSKLEGVAHVDDPHEKHHLSGLLHRGRGHAEQAESHDLGPTKHLDDWKRAGVARLTLADRISDEPSSTSKSAWWERDGPGSKRRTSNATKAEKGVSILDGNYEDGNGMIPISLLDHSTGPHALFRRSRVSADAALVRRYVSDGEASKLRQRVSITGLYRSRSLQRSLTAFYSYSCPKLAEHDLSHISHICKPYLSKELIRSMRSIRVREPAVSTTFNPPLYLKCGPLLRYTGLKHDKLERPGSRDGSIVDRETWRGSVMIVTADQASAYDPAPSLCLFHQPMDLLPPPQEFDGTDGDDLPSEYVDPIAGLPKMTRSGGTVYVKPSEDLEEGVDVSQIEDDDGLFEVTRTANVPTAYGKADELLGRTAIPASTKNKPSEQASRRPSKFREVKGVRLHAERGVTFWRFNLEVELGEKQARIAYRINNAASIGFWVPAKGESMNIMFHSCNGFSASVNPADFSGPDPLWRDVLNTHQTRPFHVMLGGGDQIYNDAVMKQTTYFQEWLAIKNPHHKHEAQFTPEMQNELETFYLERYLMWFSQGLFGMANSQIPMVNMWDDHDIIDGFGSYPHHFMSTPVFSGLGNVAFKYYMLFQHQSVPDELTADEPSWLLGASPGPYINELSRSVFMFLGKHVAFLGLDCRTERMREEILSEASYELAFERCSREIVPGETKHLIVLLGVPIAYPRLVWLENILTSRMMEPIKAVGRMGLLGNFLNHFDGGVEILDDLDDHWTARNHKDERNWFIEKLQDLAAENSVRITILGGDVHLAAIGQFYSNPKLRLPKDRDPRYMPNVISSAIVNTPPPEMMGDILNKRNKIHHLDHQTDEDMIPMFTHDTNGKARNNKHLLPRRNWCSISEYFPGSTPPPTPPLSQSEASEEFIPQRPPNRIQRTLSLTKDSRPANLLRRLSQSQRRPSSPGDSPDQHNSPSVQSSPIRASSNGYFPAQPLPTTPSTNGTALSRNVSAPLPIRPISNFHRRPTNLSEKAAAKGGAAHSHEVDLQYGLDIRLNCEVHQKDPAGRTVPYRLLVPALWYGDGVEGLAAPERKKSLLKRLGSLRGSRREAPRPGGGEWGGIGSETGSESESDVEIMRYGPGKLTKRYPGISMTRSQSQTQGQSQRQVDSPSGIETRSPTQAQYQSQMQSQNTEPRTSTSYASRQPASPQHNSPYASTFDPGNPLISNYQAVGPLQRTRSKLDASRSSQSFGGRPVTADDTNTPQRARGNYNSSASNNFVAASPATPQNQDDGIPVQRTRSKFDANGSSKFFGSPPPDGAQAALPQQRRGSRFDAEEDGGFFENSSNVQAGAGGYDGIEAYKGGGNIFQKLLGRGRRGGVID
ncbi:hypothetical protein MMC13_007697 [Lambiella insularis]|nr:hypothetical protein [Lambiella insularis]